MDSAVNYHAQAEGEGMGKVWEEGGLKKWGVGFSLSTRKLGKIKIEEKEKERVVWHRSKFPVVRPYVSRGMHQAGGYPVLFFFSGFAGM